MTKGATSYKETKFGILPRNQLVRLEAEGVKRGLKFLEAKLKKQTSLDLTPDLIKSLHQKAFGWIFPEWAGKYRIIQVTYSGKEAPSFLKVAELILNLCRDFNERFKYLPQPKSEKFVDAAIKLLAWFQHGFVFIHPFNDYNGRTARMLTTLILVKLKLPPLEIKAETGKDRRTYIKAMQQADEGEFTLLEKLLSKALEEALWKYHEISNR